MTVEKFVCLYRTNQQLSCEVCACVWSCVYVPAHTCVCACACVMDERCNIRKLTCLIMGIWCGTTIHHVKPIQLCIEFFMSVCTNGFCVHKKGQTILSPHSSLFTITNTAVFVVQLSTLAQAIGEHVHPKISVEVGMVSLALYSVHQVLHVWGATRCKFWEWQWIISNLCMRAYMERS